MLGAAQCEASKQQPASPGALAAAAEGAVTRSRSKVKPHELKSFTVAAPVEADPNTQEGGRPAPGSAPAMEPQQPTRAAAALRRILVHGFASMLEELKQPELVAAAAQHQACATTAAAAAAATQLDVQHTAAYSSSSSNSASYEQQQGCSTQVQGSFESGSSACSPMQAALAAKPLFKLPRFDYGSDLRSLTRLARISSRTATVCQPAAAEWQGGDA